MIAVLDKNNKVVSLPGGGKPSYSKGVIDKPVYDDAVSSIHMMFV